MKIAKFPSLNKDFEKGKIKIRKGKKPYIYQDGKISKFKIWIVDGEYIRKNICEDFVNLGQHYLYKFIPKNEFWIAKEAYEGEENYYVNHLLIENKLMASGVPYDKAYVIAAKTERKERKKSLTAKKIEKENPQKKELIKKTHIKLLQELKNGICVWLINGEIVRDFFYSSFAGGGHDKVYNFIPKKEIWIDNDIPKKERKFIMLHEIHERNLMEKRISYKNAHYSATKIEDFARQNPKKINSLIKQEII